MMVWVLIFKMKKNTISITGGAGFVGSNLISLLLNKTKFKIISIDNYSTGSQKNHIRSSRIRYVRGDTKNISYNILPDLNYYNVCKM